MRLIDADKFEAFPVEPPEGYSDKQLEAYAAGATLVLEKIDASPAIDPESLPVVQDLRKKVQVLQRNLDDWEYWMGYRRRAEAESAREDRAAVKVIQKRCEQTIEELREQLAKVTEERDAAVKDRAGLADYELAACEQFCLGDREHDIAPCAWLIDGMCKLREWRGPNAKS